MPYPTTTVTAKSHDSWLALSNIRPINSPTYIPCVQTTSHLAIFCEFRRDLASVLDDLGAVPGVLDNKIMWLSDNALSIQREISTSD